MFRSNDGTNWGSLIGLVIAIGIIMIAIGYHVTPQKAVFIFVIVSIFNISVSYIVMGGNSFQKTVLTFGVIGTSIATGFFLSIGQMLQ